MALSFIGKPISLISHSDVRYRGILAGIDPQASTIQLSRVYSMGTEGRRPPNEFIPPVAEPYEYIIFRASEVKDLSVDEAPMAGSMQRNVHDDPAVVGAGPAQPPQSQQQQQQQSQQQQQQQQPRGAGRGAAGRSNSIHTAMESVERAIASNKSKVMPQVNVPNIDFDFASSNARFNKSVPPASSSSSAGLEEDDASYNPQKSFFDTLSPAPQIGRGRGGGRGRRQEERDRNVATFGEPGGVGLLGPGAYVGGWGGHAARRGAFSGQGQGRGQGRGRGQQ